MKEVERTLLQWEAEPSHWRTAALGSLASLLVVMAMFSPMPCGRGEGREGGSEEGREGGRVVRHWCSGGTGSQPFEDGGIWLLGGLAGHADVFAHALWKGEREGGVK